MVSRMDDYPVHQIAEPVRHAGTSDRNFYDRYYFNMHNCSDELFVIFGMGQYPNLGTQDAFVCCRRGDEHRVVRASRELGDRMDTSVGPFRIEVLEGLRKVRFVVDSNPHGIEVDVTWDAACPAALEGRHFRRQLGRVTFDTSRFAQTGRWSGTLRVAGNDYKVTPDRWMGTRDRSWGVRPVGEPEPPGIRAGGMGAMGAAGWHWNYFPMQFDDYSIVYICEEDGEGNRALETATRMAWDNGSELVEHLGRPDHRHVFRSGTRMPERSMITFTPREGDPLVVTATPIFPVFLTVETGYGGGPWGHGTYHGKLEVDGVVMNMKEHPERFQGGFFDSVGRFERDDGAVGWGLFEFTLVGANAKYGFKTFQDVAP